MVNGNNVRDELVVSATAGVTDNPVFTILNGLLGALWRACAQHQTHIALIEAWGLQGLADAMRVRTADEPVAIRAVLNRLVDLDGTPAFTIEVPVIGVTVREILDNDMALQRHTRPKLNAAAEAVGATHDATTRNLIEQILADEEQHLSWLKPKSLCTRSWESLYIARAAFRRGPRALHR
jgi:bacterioferritin